MNERLDPDRGRDLMEACAAYDLMLDAVSVHTQQGAARQEPERIRYLGGIVERAAARQREREQQAAQNAAAP